MDVTARRAALGQRVSWEEGDVARTRREELDPGRVKRNMRRRKRSGPGWKSKRCNGRDGQKQNPADLAARGVFSNSKFLIPNS